MTKLTATDKAQLATYRLQGFPTEMLVAVGSGANRELGSVISSNGFITSVLTFSPVLGKVITRSWATRGVKPARHTF